ncbi:MAG: hypothetical protein M1834_008259 [Cirrosporium novae-zelandiae]|nr:MAG: hypothetical protein M1834_008259 [Cirrosporium novae-zelandiae]
MLCLQSARLFRVFIAAFLFSFLVLSIVYNRTVLLRPGSLSNIFSKGSTSNHGISSTVSGVNGSSLLSAAWWTSEIKTPRFAYVQYTTHADYMCNAMINVHKLERLEVQADIVIMYPSVWDGKVKNGQAWLTKKIIPTLANSHSLQSPDSREAKLLAAARLRFPRLILKPVDILSTSSGDATWRDSLTKFQAFRLTDYTRVLSFDSDSLVLNNMDHLFLSPKCQLAVPRAYWLNDPHAALGEQVLASHIMLLEPDDRIYERIEQEAKRTGDFDMEIVNHLFNNSAMILPHRRLALLTGEFRSTDHQMYLEGEGANEWNAHAELSRAFFVHFSDWPLPKPWKSHTEQQWNAAVPACVDEKKTYTDRPPCADRSSWLSVYGEYEDVRKNTCSIQ